jgi:hypothetical protein
MAAVGAASAESVNVSHFLKMYQRVSEEMSHEDMRNIDHHEFIQLSLGDEAVAELADEHVEQIKNWKEYNVDMNEGDRIAHWHKTFSAKLANSNDDETMVETAEGAPTSYTDQNIFNWVDMMYQVKSNSALSSSNKFNKRSCKSNGDDSVCYSRHDSFTSGTKNCAIAFRGSDSFSDWAGYLSLFVGGAPHTIHSNSQRGHSPANIRVPMAFENEWNSIDSQTSDLIDQADSEGCTKMNFVGSSLGGGLAEIAFQEYGDRFATSVVVSLDSPKVSTYSGCRGESGHFRAWYESSVVSSAPHPDMGYWSGHTVPTYYHVTSSDGSWKLDKDGNKSSSGCTSNPGVVDIYSSGIPKAKLISGGLKTAKYHGITHWIATFEDGSGSARRRRRRRRRGY